MLKSPIDKNLKQMYPECITREKKTMPQITLTVSGATKAAALDNIVSLINTGAFDSYGAEGMINRDSYSYKWEGSRFNLILHYKDGTYSPESNIILQRVNAIAIARIKLQTNPEISEVYLRVDGVDQSIIDRDGVYEI